MDLGPPGAGAQPSGPFGPGGAQAGPAQRLAFTTVQRGHQAVAAQPILTASATLQRLAAEVAAEPLALQSQIDAVRAGLPEGAEQATLQRQAERAQPPTLPLAFQRRPDGSPAGRPPSLSDWGQAYAYELARLPPHPRGGYASGPLVHIQRQISAGLVRSAKTSPLPPAQRYAELGQTLAQLQRQPLGAEVVRASWSQLLPAERPAIQRALDEANATLQWQDAQDARVEQLHHLQRQLAEQQTQGAQDRVMQRIQARQGGGDPLPLAVQRHLERGLNADLSKVRLHTDSEAHRMAKDMQALAFTSGQDIYFQHGHAEFNTRSGLELLAHEVAHTVQQAQGPSGAGGRHRQRAGAGGAGQWRQPGRTGPHSSGAPSRHAAPRPTERFALSNARKRRSRPPVPKTRRLGASWR